MNKSEIADEIDNIIALINTCCLALGNKEEFDKQASQISESLFFIAIPLLKKIKEGLEECSG